MRVQPSRGFIWNYHRPLSTHGNGTDIGLKKTGTQIQGPINLGSDHICIMFLVLFKLQQYVIFFEWLRYIKV